MPIHRLPQHLINKLKAGEIVERPASLLKELLENSLDAGATELQIWIEQGGKKLIKIQDNGSGIAYEDLPLVLERYATSKIQSEADLEKIMSYGFRGEALASIAEVSGCVVQTKKLSSSSSEVQQISPQPPQISPNPSLTRGERNSAGSRNISEIESFGYQLQKIGEETLIEPMSLSYEHGTTVIISDVFASIPARHKFLKSDVTERGYNHSLLVEYLLIHHQKSWKIRNNGKIVRDLKPATLIERISDIFNKSWLPNLSPFERGDGVNTVYGVTSRAALHFGSPNYIHIFVNGRPVTDKIIKKAILESYNRQLVPGNYPCTVLFLDIKPDLVDVNVHPRKTEVKFLDPKSIFTIIKNVIDEQIGNQKVSYAHFNQQTIQTDFRSKNLDFRKGEDEMIRRKEFQQRQVSRGEGLFQGQLTIDNQQFSFGQPTTENQQPIHIEGKNYRIISQLRDMYILLEGEDGLLLVDQHALAERIAFEKMRQEIANANANANSELLLTPLVVSYPKILEIDVTIDQLNQQGWDVSRFGEGKVIVYAVPAVFQKYQLDLELVLNHIWGRENIDFGVIFDEIVGMKACKASIKAGQRLSMLEMEQLMKDGVHYIDGMFVCQHGRPNIVAIKKSQLDGMFER